MIQLPHSLEEKIGQMLWLGWQGESPEAAWTVSARARTLVEEFQVGGVILMGRNLRDPRQVAELTAGLQSASPVPLLIGVDQEGGSVSRLTLPGLTFPGNMALGALNDSPAVAAAMAAIGEQLLAMGINVDFAPVLDVNNNPDNPVIGVRSFGEHPERVAELGVAALRGFAQAGVVACGKHFPGHGDTAVDSHLDLPVQPADRLRLDGVELRPFRAAIAAGAPLLMTAHIRFPALDDRWPATLSPSILTDLLRGELGYTEVVVTDCLEMDGIAKHFGVEEAAVAAVQAGADCLLACHTQETQRRIRNALLQAVHEGRLPGSRIDRSVQRILDLKNRYGLGTRAGADSSTAAETVGAPRFRRLEQELAERAVTVVCDRENCLPIAPGPVRIAGSARAGSALVDALRAEGVAASRETMDAPGAFATGLLLVSRGDPETEEAGVTLRRWLGQGTRVIVIAVREPYVLAEYADVACQIATYGDGDPNIRALARVLTGRARPEGRLPVSLVRNPLSGYNASS